MIFLKFPASVLYVENAQIEYGGIAIGSPLRVSANYLWSLYVTL